MSIAEADAYWLSTADFIKKSASRIGSIVAPREFSALIPNVTAYEHVSRHEKPDVLVLHKGMMEQLGRHWIDRATAALHPSFANEVFVVFSKLQVPAVTKSAHFRAFVEKLDLLPKVKSDRIPVHRPAIYLGEHRALTRTLDGAKLYVDTRDFSLAPHILLDGEWEPWVTEAFKRMLHPGMRVVEVGANIGYYSVLAGSKIGPDGRLFVFEANPQLHEILFANIHINGLLERSTVVNKAVSSRSGPLQFNVFGRYLGSSSLFACDAAAAHYLDKLETITVEGITLDEYFETGFKLDLLKMDAEGAEPHIIRGADRMIRENPGLKILMEFAPSIIRTHTSLDDFLSQLSRYGFECHVIAHDSSLRETPFNELLNYDHCEVVLSRRGS